MNVRSLRRVGVATMVTALAAASAFVGTAASAAAPGPYSGYAHATAVHVDDVTNGDTRAANTDVGVTNAAVDSDGLNQFRNAFQRQVVPAVALGKNAVGESQVAEAAAAGEPDAEGQGQLPGGTVAFAPGGEGKTETLVPRTQASPAVNAVGVLRTASATWNPDTCVLGQPISQGTFEAARVEAADQAPSEATTNFDQEAVGIVADADGPARDAVNDVSLTQLYDGSGAGFGLMAASMSTIAPVTLLAGTPNETTIEVLGPALLRAMADGTAGGAKVEFSAPAVSIIQNGVRNVILPNDETKLLQLPAGDGGILEIRIAQLDVNQRAGNGTSATAKGAIVTVEVLGGAPAPDGLRGATVVIGHVEASVTVPVGGITCALRVDVDADPNAVGAGKTVEVTTTVHNDFDCPLQAVTLIDTLTTEADATFTITEAAGAVRKSPGTGLTTGAVEWLIPSIAPHASAQRSFMLRMDSGAGKVHISGNAAGKLANCKVAPGKDDASVSGLGVGNANVGGVGSVNVPVSRVLGGGVTPGKDLPTTGVASSAAAGLFMLTTAGGLVTALRRRSFR